MKLFLLLFGLLWLPTLYSASGEQEAASLKGIKAVAVLVEDLTEYEQRLGLTKDVIQTDAELKLRLAGVRLLSRSDPPGPWLYIRVTASPNGSALSVEVHLKQLVRLVSDPRATVLGTTWDSIEVLGRPSNSQTIRDFIKDRVDQYLNAWLSVNPK